MADKAAKKGKGDGEPKAKSNLVPAIVVALGLIMAGKFMGGGSKGSATAAGTAASAAGTETTIDCAAADIKKPPKKGAVYKMDSINVNLADGHFLKVGVALQLDATLKLDAFDKDGEGAKALDKVIAGLGGHSPDEFATPEAVDRFKSELLTQIRPLYECHVLDLLFTEFVMQ